MTTERWRRLLPGLWAGWMLCVALLAAPSAFALLAPAEAGRLVARLLAGEAYASLLLGAVLLVLERVAARRAAEAAEPTAGGTGSPSSSQFSPGMLLALGALACTVAGYFGVLPAMQAARAGAGPFSFGQLHAVSSAFYLVKLALVAALAWRAARPAP